MWTCNSLDGNDSSRRQPKMKENKGFIGTSRLVHLIDRFWSSLLSKTPPWTLRAHCAASDERETRNCITLARAKIKSRVIGAHVLYFKLISTTCWSLSLSIRSVGGSALECEIPREPGEKLHIINHFHRMASRSEKLSKIRANLLLDCLVLTWSDPKSRKLSSKMVHFILWTLAALDSLIGFKQSEMDK